MGILYLKGQGVPRDDSLAVAWFTKAAERGDRDGQANLATLYEAGRGIARDLKRAYMWRLVSIRGTSLEQSAQLRELALGMDEMEVAEARRSASDWVAAQRSDPPDVLELHPILVR